MILDSDEDTLARAATEVSSPRFLSPPASPTSGLSESSYSDATSTLCENSETIPSENSETEMVVKNIKIVVNESSEIVVNENSEIVVSGNRDGQVNDKMVKLTKSGRKPLPMRYKMPKHEGR